MTGIFWGASGLTGNLAMLCLLGYGELRMLRGDTADQLRWDTGIAE
jgi:ATP-binding cassette subfamily B (MDR/TAP) protein 10